VLCILPIRGVSYGAILMFYGGTTDRSLIVGLHLAISSSWHSN
jgi:hypothetical protein